MGVRWRFHNSCALLNLEHSAFLLQLQLYSRSRAGAAARVSGGGAAHGSQHPRIDIKGGCERQRHLHYIFDESVLFTGANP